VDILRPQYLLLNLLLLQGVILRLLFHQFSFCCLCFDECLLNLLFKNVLLARVLATLDFVQDFLGILHQSLFIDMQEFHQKYWAFVVRVGQVRKFGPSGTYSLA
jgi:hypothetical protein